MWFIELWLAESIRPGDSPKEEGPQQVLKRCVYNPFRESRREKVFYFFACNPLKSPDSAKEMQANPSNFAWIYLDFLAMNSRPG
jgi:hypothetical protein